MKRLCLTLVLFAGCFAQPAPRPCPAGTCGTPTDDINQAPAPDPNFPNRKTRELIVKEDYKRNLEDSAALARLAADLKADLESGDKNVVSVKAMKKAEDIEKLARNIRTRLKRY